MGEADVLRRAMGKKKPEELMAQRSKFIREVPVTGSRAIASGLLTDGILRVADLTSLILRPCRLLPNCLPQSPLSVEYMCAFLSSVIDNQDRVVFILRNVTV